MKKLYCCENYKKIHKRRLYAFVKKKRKKKKRQYISPIKRNTNIHNTEPIVAPEHFSLIENTSDCLKFFSAIRNQDNCTLYNGLKTVEINLSKINIIDYAAISALIAICENLKNKRVNIRGNLPLNEDCKRLMIESGFLNQMFDDKGKRFKKMELSETIVFEKGEGRLSEKDNNNISEVVKKIVRHLTGEENKCLPVKSCLLEICSNSIEHSQTQYKQWLLGVKYEENKVLLSVTDVGKGILKTLYRKHGRILYDNIFRTDLMVLKGAFNKKYGSNTQEINRNKGLPFIKSNSEKGVLLNLIVITNNVSLHFANDKFSKNLKKQLSFKGTIYQWELTKESIYKAT